MKHIWWSAVITIWLAVAGWATLTVTGYPRLATSVAHTGAGIGICFGALLLVGLCAGALDD